MSGEGSPASRGGPHPYGQGARGSIRRLLSVLVAAASALVVWALAVPVAGVALTVRMGGGTQVVGPMSVIVAGLAAGLAGWGLLAVLERSASRPGRVWTFVAVAVLILSLLGPLGSAVGGAATAVLIVMHLVVGAVLLAGLVRR
ncbi:DUF6069 family protein [Nonomuraea sp. NPDC049309]|uniref:DUF6069 family protein n=1 Tax=Nonomuraea sp. NPDC049309 TaxID=3364350 RepID=UPI00371FE79A